MIKNFTFENFLSFKEKNTFTFERQSNDNSHKEAFFELQGTDLLKSAVIYGANASGKSNFSKAFVFFHQLITNGLQLSLANIPIQVKPFLLNTKTENQSSSFEVELLTKKDRFIYGFEVTSERVHREWLYQFVNNRQRILFDRKNNEITTNPHHFKEATADLKKMTRSNVLFLTVLASYNGEIANEVVEEIKEITVFPADQKEMILEYSFQNYPKYKNEVWEMVREADFGMKALNLEQKEITKEEFERPFPIQIRDMMTAGKNKFFHQKASTLHAKYDENNKEVEDVAFDFMTQESAGTRQMFGLSVLFVDALKEGKILFLDELSSSLHPFLCKFIMKIFNSKEKNPKNAQLIFTTHDTSLLDSDILRRDQIWFAEKNKYGASNLFSLGDLGERKDLSYGKRYFEGRYGALPYIKTLESIDEI